MRDALVSPLLAAAARGAVILFAALVITTLLHRRSAAARHAVWAGAIGAQLVLLALAVWGPRWNVAAPEALGALVPAQERSVSGGRGVEGDSPRADRIPQPTTAQPTPDAGPAASPAASDVGRVSVAPSAPAESPRPIPLRTIVLALWAFGAAVVLLRLAAGTVIVSRLARRGRRVDDGGWLSMAQRLATTLGIDRPLTLLRGDRLGVPVTWGVVYPVVLLPDDADAWPEERRRYVLVHEMAHVKRLDALTQLVGQVALALFWFDPLMWIAVRRMQLEREHACDDYVLRHGTQPSRYAEDLLSMVQSLGTPEHRAAQPAFAALAMARRSEFEGRMLSILDPVLDRHPLHRGRTLMGALASLLVIVPLAALQPYRPVRAATQSIARSSVSSTAETSAAPSRSADIASSATNADRPLSVAVQSLDSAVASTGAKLDRAGASLQTGTPAKSASGATGHDDSCERYQVGNRDNTQFHMHADDDGAGSTIRYLDFNERRCVQADIRGKIITTDDEDHIVTMSPAGSSRAYFRERTGGVDRELTFTSTSGGSATGTIVYRLNGVAAPYDEAGRRWFADLLPRVLAEAAVNVEPRVKHWRAQGGADNALRHIAELHSSGAKRAHYDVLLETQLSASELDRLVKQAGRDIPSSGDLRAVLSKAAPQTRSTKVSASALDSAISAIASSADRTAVLELFSKTSDRDQLLAVMRVAKDVPSSGDKSRLLVEVVDRYVGRNDDALHRAWFEVARTIPSSADLSRVLQSAVPHAVKSDKAALSIMTASSEIPSSVDRADVFVALADAGAIRSQLLRDEYLMLVKEIPASSEIRRALEALTRR